MQMGLAAVLIHALHAPLEDREIAFNGVGMNGRDFLVHILTGAVIGCAVAREMSADAVIDARLVGHHDRLFSYILHDDRHDGFRGHIVHDHGASLARIAIDQREHLHLVVERAALGSALDAADEGLANLDDAAARTEGSKVAGAHRFANPVREKPCALIGDFEDAMELMGADALLAARHQVGRLKHLVERDARVLEHGADLGGELTLAIATAMKADTDALGRVGLDLGYAINAAAMRAYGNAAPDDGFEVRESRFLVMKMGSGKNGHRLAP